MTRAEQETILRWAADEDMVSVFTAHPATKRKLEKAGYRPYRVSTERGAEIGWFYRVPITELRWRVGARKRRMAEGQRQAVADRLSRARLGRDSLRTARAGEVASTGAAQ